MTCSSFTGQVDCGTYSIECVWVVSNLGATQTCQTKPCYQLTSTFCVAQGCSHVGSDASSDYLCYPTGTSACVRPPMCVSRAAAPVCGYYLSAATCTAVSGCLFNSAYSFCYSSSDPCLGRRASPRR